jgi:hypothetical protein
VTRFLQNVFVVSFLLGRPGARVLLPGGNLRFAGGDFQGGTDKAEARRLPDAEF